MKRNGRVYILAGVVLALVAGGLIFLFLNQMTEQASRQVTPTPVPDVDVIVLAKDVTAGTLLTGEHLKRETVKANAPGVGPESVRDLTEAVDRMIVTDAKSGQMIKRGDLQALPFVLPKGKKAMALFLDDLSTVAGLVRERDYIDVLVGQQIKLSDNEKNQPATQPQANPEAPDSVATINPVDQQLVVKAVLQRIQVLKIVLPQTAQTTQTQAPPAAPAAPAASGTPVATPGAEAPKGRIINAKTIMVLAVSDQEAELIKFAQDSGTLQLVLRGRDDADSEETKGMTLDILIRDYGLPVPRPVVVDIKPEG